MLKVEKCVFCDCSFFKKLPWFYWRQEKKINVIECKNCGLATLEFIPEDIEEIYNCEYLGGYPSTNYIEHKIKKFKNLYLKHIKFYCPQGRVLEIGSGFGPVLKLFKELNYEIIGVELSAEVASIAKEISKTNIMVGRFEEIDFPNEFFDCILAQDVIEHIKDPVYFLSKINGVLKKNGLVVLILPFEFNYIGCFLEKYFNFKRDKGELHHLYFYRPNVLKKILNKTGFNILFKKEYYTWTTIQSIRKYRIKAYLKMSVLDPINYLITKIFNIFGGRGLIIAQKI
jgi:SAM-dependent methyltransferase